VSAATAVGATVIPVAGGMGFSAGQTITIDSGANQEMAVVAPPAEALQAVLAPQALAGAALAAALQSPSPRRSSLRTRLAHRSPAAASPLPLR